MFDSRIRELFTKQARWQAWLDVESALASVQAEVGLVPHEAAEVITPACRIECLDLERVRDGGARMTRPLMPFVVELSRVVGEP